MRTRLEHITPISNEQKTRLNLESGIVEQQKVTRHTSSVINCTGRVDKSEQSGKLLEHNSENKQPALTNRTSSGRDEARPKARSKRAKRQERDEASRGAKQSSSNNRSVYFIGGQSREDRIILAFI